MGELQSSNPKHRHRATPPKSRRRTLVHAAGTVVAVATLLVTGSGYWMAHGVLSGITVSQALGAEDPKSSGDGMNILLIGLDSRKDQNGDDLPWSVLKHLHAGDSDDGGYNTNTLILAHVGADDKVSAFSIPRDDWVSFNGVPGYNHIKIKEAYGLTKQYVEQKMIDKGVSDQKQLETKGREAARAATLKAVRKLTGAPIDYFAEVNLAGFYDLANSLGGVDVCLKHAVYDDYSGANFPAGPQTLDAAQALAFVRQRHGLENGDLDRTHRQQAFLSSVMHQLQDTRHLHQHRKAERPDGGGAQGRRAVGRLGRGHVPQDGRPRGRVYRIPNPARGALRQHQRPRRQHRRPRGDQSRSGGCFRVIIVVNDNDYRRDTQPFDCRRRGERKQRRRPCRQGGPHAEARRLHHRLGARPGSR